MQALQTHAYCQNLSGLRAAQLGLQGGRSRVSLVRDYLLHFLDSSVRIHNRTSRGIEPTSCVGELASNRAVVGIEVLYMLS